MDDFVEVIRRLNRVPRPKSEGAPVGISAERVRTIAVRMNMQVPVELVQWLSVCNGYCMGPGGLFGMETTRDFFDIETYITIFPSWKAHGWIPSLATGAVTITA